MKRFKNILCIVDPENMLVTSVGQSVKIAEDHQAEITFISIFKPAHSKMAKFSLKEQPNLSLNQLIETKRNALIDLITDVVPGIEPKVIVELGIDFIQIIRRVMVDDHDLVVKCAEDQDWIDHMLGSEDMHLLRKCPCPLLLLKPDHETGFKNILATVDVNEEPHESEDGRIQEQLNHLVLQYSSAICASDLTEFHIGSAWQAYGEDYYRYGAFSRIPEDDVNKYVDQVRLEYMNNMDRLKQEMETLIGKQTIQYLQPKTHMIKGGASKEIPILAEKLNIDLIVMGTVGRIGIPGMLIGNTAESILQQTRCSILAIKPPGFKSPIG